MVADYSIIRSVRRRTLSLQIKGGRLLVRAPFWTNDSRIARFVQEHQDWIEKNMAKALRQQQLAAEVPKLTAEEMQILVDKALKQLPERVGFYAPKVGVTYGKITIRKQQSRWGSCSAKGNLNFNVLLMLTPPQVLDSVVVHELCHRKEMNHSPRFYAEVLRVYPEYRIWDKWLKKHGREIMSRGRDV